MTAITVDEAAELLRVNRKTVYECIKSGKLPALHVGRHIRLSRETVLRMLAEGEPLAKGKQRK